VVAGNDNGREISRRQFTATLGAVAGLTAGANLLTPAEVSAAPHINPRIIGANDRVVVASIGVRGQGNAVKRGFAKLANVEVKTLCDVDENVGQEKLADKQLAEVASYKPGFEQDLRKVYEDKDVDAVIIATPNHWHALATIWGLQAGKHVYVEKPASHTVVEGRRMVQAQARYKKLVQVGTMNRSRPAVIKAIDFVKGGGIGKVYMARGLCFKPRPGIGKYPDGLMQPGEQYKLNEATSTIEPAYDAAYMAKVNYDLWLGPAPKREFNRNRFHYNWHWHWDYGNGDTGNQGPHQFDIARWGLGKQDHPVKIKSVGGYFGPPASQETPDLQTTTYEYADGIILEFATRGQATNPEGPVEIGNIFYGSEGYLWIDADGRQWQSYLGRKAEKGPGSDAATAGSTGSDPRVLTSIEYPHYQNFIDAIRADDPKILTCNVLEGHLSSTLPHLANISYRVGRALTFDGRTETIVGDKEASALLTRTYRKGFELPVIGNGPGTSNDNE
jgi:predicted dehydrogenase